MERKSALEMAVIGIHELLSESYGNPCGSTVAPGADVTNNTYVFGTAISSIVPQYNCGGVIYPKSGTGSAIDLRGGAVTSQSQVPAPVPTPPLTHYVYYQTQSTAYKYDAAGRRTSGLTTYKTVPYPPDDKPGTPTYLYYSTTSAYDANNKQISLSLSGTSSSNPPPVVSVDTGAWDVNGHLAKQTEPISGGSGPTQADYLHYDGNNLLFVTSGSGVVETVKFEDKLNNTSLGGTPFTTVLDRDDHGGLVSAHNARGHATLWTPAGFLGQVYDTASAADSYFAYGPFANVNGDGFVTDFGTAQGVRMYDAATQQWTTPDVFSGDVHDPRASALTCGTAITPLFTAAQAAISALGQTGGPNWRTGFLAATLMVIKVED